MCFEDSRRLKDIKIMIPNFSNQLVVCNPIRLNRIRMVMGGGADLSNLGAIEKQPGDNQRLTPGGKVSYGMISCRNMRPAKLLALPNHFAYGLRIIFTAYPVHGHCCNRRLPG